MSNCLKNQNSSRRRLGKIPTTKVPNNPILAKQLTNSKYILFKNHGTTLQVGYLPGKLEDSSNEGLKVRRNIEEGSLTLSYFQK